MALAIEPRGACNQTLGQALKVGAEGPNRTRYGTGQTIGRQGKLRLATLDHKRWVVEARAACGRIERIAQASRIGIPGAATALIEHLQVDLGRPNHRCHRGTQTLMARLEHIGQLRHSRRHRFCRGRGRGGPAVAHHVADRGIGLMANAGHHRHGTGRHSAGKLLVVKGHEVLEGTTATHEQNAIGRRRNGSGAAQAFNKLRRRTLALDLCTHADKLDERVATAQRTLDVVDHGARKRGDDCHARAKHRNATFARLVHQALATQLFGQLSHLLTQQALPCQRERAGDEAHAARRLVEIEAALKAYLHAVAQIEGTLEIGALPDDAVDGRRVVLDLKVAVAASGIGTTKTRDLTQNAQLRNGIERAGGDLHRLAHAELFAFLLVQSVELGGNGIAGQIPACHAASFRHRAQGLRPCANSSPTHSTAPRGHESPRRLPVPFVIGWSFCCSEP